jgi:hypothetical protein
MKDVAHQPGEFGFLTLAGVSHLATLVSYFVIFIGSLKLEVAG